MISAHGSAASLLSGGSSLYGSAEERQLHEVRRLKRELVDARDQVMSLSSQLSTNVSRIFGFFYFEFNIFKGRLHSATSQKNGTQNLVSELLEFKITLKNHERR